MTTATKAPGIFTTPEEVFETRTKQSAQTHARPAFIGSSHGYADPAVALFTGKNFIGILHLEDARRLSSEIQAAIRQHPGQD